MPGRLAKREFLVFTWCLFGLSDAEMTVESRQKPPDGKNPLLLLIIYLAFIFLGAALVAPVFYFAAQSLAGHSETLQWVAKNPFHRFVHRSMLVFAVLGLWPFCRMTRLTWKGLGLRFTVVEGQRFWMGILVGGISLGIMAGVALAAGARTIQVPDAILVFLLKTAFTALLVGTVEEIIFRGAVFGGLRLRHRWQTALLVSSALYALVHFFSRPAPPPEVTWSSGFFILKEMLGGFIDLEALIPGFFNLALAGAILSAAFQFTGTVSFSIGLHVSWIFCLQTYAAFTQKAVNANEWLWGTKKLIDGWAAMVVLLVTLLLVWGWNRRTKAQP